MYILLNGMNTLLKCIQCQARHDEGIILYRSVGSLTNMYRTANKGVDNVIQ